MRHITTAGRPACTSVGTRQAQELSRCKLDPYVVQPARIFPSHQKLLYFSTLVVSMLKRSFKKIIELGQEGTNHAGHEAAVRWVSKLDGVSWSSSGGNTRTETEHEATADKLVETVGGALDCSTDEDEHTANENADTTTIPIGKQTTKGECGDLAQVVHNEDNARG